MKITNIIVYPDADKSIPYPLSLINPTNMPAMLFLKMKHIINGIGAIRIAIVDILILDRIGILKHTNADE